MSKEASICLTPWLFVGTGLANLAGIVRSVYCTPERKTRLTSLCGTEVMDSAALVSGCGLTLIHIPYTKDPCPSQMWPHYKISVSVDSWLDRNKFWLLIDSGDLKGFALPGQVWVLLCFLAS